MADNKFRIIRIGLLFLLFIIPLGRFPISFSESLNLPQLITVYAIFLLLLFIYWMYIVSFKEKSNFVKTNSLYIPLGLFFLWSVLSLIWTVSIPATFTQVYYFLFYLLAFFISFNVVENDKDRKKFLEVLLFSALIVSIYAIHQYFWGLEETRQYLQMYKNEITLAGSGNFMSRLNTDRAFSTFLYPNTLATFLMMVFPFSIFCAIFYSKTGAHKSHVLAVRGLSFILSLLILFAFMLTFSKGGTVVLILSWLLFLLFKVPKSRKIIAVIGFVFLLAFTIFYVYNDDYIESKLQPVKASSRVRGEYWRAGLEMLKEKPLVGFGLGSFGRIYAKYKLPKAEETQMAHNDFLQIWTELGAVGFLIFLNIFIFYFRQMNRQIKKIDNLSSIQKVFICGGYVSVLSFAFHSLGDFSFYVFNVPAILFMIMGVSLSINCEEKKVKNKKLLFAPLFVVTVFIIFLLFRVFAAEGHYSNAMNSDNSDEAIKELKLSVHYLPFGESEYRIGYHYILSQLYKQKMFQERKDFTPAIIEHLNQAIKYDKCRSLYYRELAWISLFKNDKEKAMEYIEKAISCYPTNGVNHLVMGDIYIAINKKDEALREYQIALEYDVSLKEGTDKRIQELK
ncbi:MAG: O-antigen ligase family protein [Candidatus Omnitrophica bacterium]|nr:O-antigen ligase family protein [Candidatus Omnitrophota bacterium]MBU1047209.1 O-antigen ligase family protein [Candidatus Omnitrophota bacterium]MBU1889509.1 O-antigen ligase family protein [Candidatus Omnitrophota bacterium]